jgi:putative nucleotidyltransferase with HDIG domain
MFAGFNKEARPKKPEYLPVCPTPAASGIFSDVMSWSALFLFSRITYRIRQFHGVLFPQYDPDWFSRLTNRLPPTWRSLAERLRPSEKAHVIRLGRAILADPTLTEATREKLMLLALTHDLGKTVTHPGLFERVMKTLLPLPNGSHPRVGAKLLQNLGAPPDLVRRIARHHDPHPQDEILRLFQRFDDSL